MSANEVNDSQNEIVEAAIETTSNPDLTSQQVMNRIVITTSTALTSSSQPTITHPTTTPGTGRQVLPVVYLNMPRNRLPSSGSPSAVTVLNQNSQMGGIVLNNVAQVLPPGARTFLPGLAQKITVATTNSASTPTVSSSNHFVTIRSTSQTSNTNTPVTAQTHFVTIPKEALPEGILKPQSTQQFVAMVPKSSFTGSTSGGQIVTIRAPLMAGAQSASSGSTQNQILTIQSPVLQQGSNQATLVPISGTTSSGKPQVSYISPVVKNGSVPNLVANTSKMVLSTVATLQKTPVTFPSSFQGASTSTVSPTTVVPVSSVPVNDIVSVTKSTPTIAVVPSTEQTPSSTVTIATPKDGTSQPIVTVDTAPQTVTKDSVPTIKILPQKDPSSTTVTLPPSQPITFFSSKDLAAKKNGANPVSLLSSDDVNAAGSTVTVLSSKDTPPKSPITLVPSKDSPGAFTIDGTGNTMTLVPCKDSTGSNTFTILSSKEIPAATIVSCVDSTAAKSIFTIGDDTADSFVTAPSTKDSSQNPVSKDNQAPPNVTVLPFKDKSRLPTFTALPSKDNTATPTVTLLSSKDPSSSTPTFTIRPSKDGGNPSVKFPPSKVSSPNSIFTIVPSKEGGSHTVKIVPSREMESMSSTQESAPKRLTTLPFLVPSDMTVTSEMATVSYPQFQLIGKDMPSTGFISIGRQCSLGGVNLPESTVLTPVTESDVTTAKIDASVTGESVTVQLEPVETIRMDSESKLPKRASLLISNNRNVSKTNEVQVNTEDELSICLEETVTSLRAFKDTASSENTQTVVTCETDDEITLIKVTPSADESKKFSSLDDDPDDIKIELIQCTEELESSKESEMDLDDVSINIEKPKSRSPSPVSVIHPVISTVQSTKVTELLPNSKSLSNIRSPSILKNRIANKNRLCSPKMLISNQYPTPENTKKSKAPALKDSVSKTGQKTETKKEIKTEVKKETDSTGTPDDFDPVKALEWKNGVGTLPGSDLKFRVNEFGFIEIISDDDKDRDKAKSSQRSSHNSDDESARSADEKDVKPLKRKFNVYCEDDEDDDKIYDPDSIIECKHCGVHGLALEFVNQRYCDTTCQEKAALKKAAELKREQEHRALKLRRKRRRLERRSERGSVDVKKEDVSDDQMEVDDDDAGQSVSKTNSLDPTPVPSDDDVSLTSNDGVEISKGRGSKSKPTVEFTWVKYLESTKAKGAPAKLFKDDGTYTKNKFKVGYKLEGIDPEHPAHFCALSVAEVKGSRLRIHFDGYSESYDYWVNVDSPEIFPVGWCQKSNRRLDPPRGFTGSTFNWTTYLKAYRSCAAPKHLFPKSVPTSVCPNGFRIGMKLEAVDRKDSSLICVASVADILDNRILVHFDSWDDMYDYWVDPSSPYIHPVGWCSDNNRVLTPPNQFKDPSSFSWSAYLKETKSIPAPARAFKQRPAIGFKRGMRLEAVDKRAPQFVRVATVEEAVDHRILLHFDGWPRMYDYWVDEDSPDIHAPGWCRDTKHPLEAPLSKEDLKDTTHCVSPGCRGEGHIKGPKFSSHNTVQNCPYSPENLDKDGVVPDRLYPKGDLEYSEIPTSEKETTLNNTMRMVEGRRPLGRPRKWKRHLQEYHQNKNRRRSEDDDRDKRSMSPLETASKLQLELHQSVFEPGYRVDVGLNRSPCWAKHSLPLHSSPMLNDDTNPQTWNPSEVAKFVSTVAGLEVPAEKFTEEEIDGEALLLMTQQDLVDNIGLKLGPAIKLYNCIVLLRQKVA